MTTFKLARWLFTASLVATMIVGTVSNASGEPPSRIPVQGYLVDTQGVPVDGPTQLSFRLYDAAGMEIVCDSKSLVLDAGAFDAFIDLDLTLDIVVAQPREIGVMVGMDCTPPPTAEELRYSLGTVPYAAEATHALTSDEALLASSVEWANVQNVPLAISDGDDDTTYSEGAGLSLSGTQFSVAADGITGAMVADGALTVADFDPMAGIYMSRSRLYKVTTSVDIAPGNSGSTSALCNDLNDLPVSGFCLAASSIMTLSRSGATNWENLGALPAWECHGLNGTASTQQLIAHIICYDVP